MITLHNVWFQKYSFLKQKVIWNLKGERVTGSNFLRHEAHTKFFVIVLAKDAL